MALTRGTKPQITETNNQLAGGEDMDKQLRQQMLGIVIWKVRRVLRLFTLATSIPLALYALITEGIGTALIIALFSALGYAVNVIFWVYICVGRMTQLFLWLRSWKKGRFSMMDKI